MKKITLIFVCVFCFSLPLFSQVNTGPFKSSFNFIENKGQIVDLENKPNTSVLYLFPGNGLNVQLKKNGFSYDIYNVSKTDFPEMDNGQASKFKYPDEKIAYTFSRVDFEFININPLLKIEAKGQSQDYLNFYNVSAFKNDGITYVYHYAEVYYHNIYNNIDMQFLVIEGKPKYNFIIHPGGKISDIKIKLSCAGEAGLTQSGELLIKTDEGEITETIPESYYKNNRQKIYARFNLLDKNIFGLSAEIEPGREAIIDPSPVRAWATYVGGGNYDIGLDVTSDEDRNIIICGYTNSITNLASAGHQMYLAGDWDAFVAKFNDSGKRIWATYYGGALSGYFAGDRAFSVATDLSSNIYTAGYTLSQDNIGFRGFRDTIFSKTYNDAFLAKFNKNGIRIWGTYYGGQYDDWGYSVCTDSKANVFLAGETRSATDIAYNGYKNTFSSTSGIGDGFLVKFDSSGNRLWATYYGGPGHETLVSAYADPNDNVYIGGHTASTSGIYSNGGHQNTFAGVSDGYLAKFSPSGSLLWGTYYGGTGSDVINDIATDADSNVYIAGTTTSSTNIAYRGPDELVAKADAFVAKFNYNGVREMGTYHGSPSALTDEEGITVTVDKKGSIYLGGQGVLLNSTDKEDIFLIKYGYKKESKRYFVDKVDYFKGSKIDYCYNLATRDSTLYLVGATYSTGMSASSNHKSSLEGQMDALLMKFEEATILISNVPKGPFCKGDTFTIGYKYLGKQPVQSGNEFSVYTCDSSGRFVSKVGSLKSVSPAGSILVNITDKNKKGFSLRVFASNPEVYGEFSDTFTIRDAPTLYFNINKYYNGDTAQCLKGNRFLFDLTNTDTAEISYKVWDFGDGDSSTAWKPQKIYSIPGTYDIKLKTYSQLHNCSLQMSQTAYVWPTPTASFTVDRPVACEKDTINYINTSTSSGEPLYYNWLLSTTNLVSYVKGTSATTKNASLYYPFEKFFNAGLIVRNGYNCSDTASPVGIKVSVYPNANFLINYINRCFNGNKIEFVNQTGISSGLPKAPSYKWKYSDGDSSDATSPIKSFNTVGAKTISLTAANYLTCTHTVSKTIVVEHNPTADFTINNDTQCFNVNSFVFTNTSQFSGGSQPLSSIWRVGNVSSTTTNPTIKLNSAGKYTARLTVRSTVGCSDSIEKEILVTPSPSPQIFGPLSAIGKKESVFNCIQNQGNTYSWLVNGGAIIKGQGTNQITVLWDENTGSIGQIFLIETDAIGCSSIPVILIVNLEPSDIYKLSTHYPISVFPNPTTGLLNINPGNYNGNYSIFIYNNIGQVVFERNNIEGSNQLDLSGITPGMYFIQLESDYFIKTEKIVINKNN